MEVLHQQMLSTNESVSKNETVHISRVKSEMQNECQGQRTIVSAKRMNKLLKSGAEMYLAVITPSSIQKSGMTFKVKQQIMKEKGAVRKTPPIAANTRENVQRSTGIDSSGVAGIIKRI